MDVKPGYQTTEFWVTILTNIIGIVALFHPVNASVTGNIPAIAGILAMIAGNVVYILSRGQVKAAASVAAALPTTPAAK
jgi:uncharacterized membrane protein